VLLLGILGIAAGAGFALFAWRAPTLARGGLFAPVSREASLVLNNLFLATAATTVLLGTLYPLIMEAMTGKAISVGPPYFNLTFAPLMAAALLIIPAGPLLSWKRGDLKGVLQRLALAAGVAAAVGIAAFALTEPKKALAAAGVGLGAWVIAGTLEELRERLKLGQVAVSESLRRLRSLPTGAWGMTLAHIGLGVFVMGAAFETAWKLEAAKILTPGGRVALGGYELTLDRVEFVQGPNFTAERAVIPVTSRGGGLTCTAQPERRFYPANRQSTSKIALCFVGMSDLYVVAGDPRPTADGRSGRLIRVYWNPWARLIFFGPILMALGGVVSLGDRRLRLAVGRRAQAATQGAPA
jgi:cytochrome c-type biogenesis protein CcmF